MPWILVAAVTCTTVPLIVLLYGAYDTATWEGWNYPRLGRHFVQYYPREPEPGSTGNMSGLVYGDDGPCSFSVDMGEGRIARMWCHLEWTEVGFRLEPYLYNASAVELFREHSLNPDDDIYGTKVGNELTLSGTWGKLVSEPLYLVPRHEDDP